MNNKPPPSTKQNHVYDYLVLGAGLSGLQSLQVLSKQTRNVLVLQSQKYDGGRVLTESVASLPGAEQIQWVQQNYETLRGVFVQKGATWIEQRHTAILQICKRFGLKLREQNSAGVNLYLYRDRSIDNKELNKDPKFGQKLRQFVDRLDHLSRLYDRQVLTTPCKNYTRAKRLLSAYDLKFVSEYLQENIQSQQARELVDNFLEHTECIPCDQNSMHEVLTKNARSNDVGILKEFLGDYGHEASYLLNEGSIKLIQKFIQEIQVMRGQPRKKFIYYNEQVITVDNSRPDICIVRTLNGKTRQVNQFKGKKVICTIPLSVSRSLSFTNISKAKRLIFDNQLRTSCAKSFLIVKKPFWREFATGDGMFSSEYMVNMCHDISPPDVSCGIMVFFHNGKKFNQWESKFKSQPCQYEAKKNYIIDLTCKIFRVSPENKKQYLDTALFYISTFMDNPYIRSGFQSCTSPGTFNNILRLGDGIQAFYRDENNVVFIGSQYSQQFASYMEGAIRVAKAKCQKLIEGQEVTNANYVNHSINGNNSMRPKL